MHVLGLYAFVVSFYWVRGQQKLSEAISGPWCWPERSFVVFYAEKVEDISVLSLFATLSWIKLQ